MSKYDWIAWGSFAAIGFYIAAAIAIATLLGVAVFGGEESSFNEWWQSLTTAQAIVIAAVIYVLLGTNK